VRPATRLVAQQACRAIAGKNMHADCLFDVVVTGNPGFAKTYLASQRIQKDSTTTTVIDDKDPTQVEEPVIFTATVKRTTLEGKGAPTGVIQFMLDGERASEPIKLNENGQASWKTASLKPGKHKVTATYVPTPGSEFLSSTSPVQEHTVKAKYD
jgi:hypothetical protein